MAAGPERSSNSHNRDLKAYVSPDLLEAAQASPNATFDVIIQGARDESTAEVAGEVGDARKHDPGRGVGLRKRFRSLSAVAAQLTGRQIMRLARRSDIGAITSDAPVRLSTYWSKQRWPYVAGFNGVWNGAARRTPRRSRSWTRASRPRAPTSAAAWPPQVNMTSLQPNSPGDGRGHGTFVAGIAAGDAGRATPAARPSRRSSPSTSWTTTAWR